MLFPSCFLVGLALGASLLPPVRQDVLAHPGGPSATHQVFLPGFAALRRKLERGSVVEVSYLGGSITKGATTFPRVDVGPNGPYDYSAYNEQLDSYRALSFQQLRDIYEQWPGQLIQNNSSLGATGSELSNYRFARDIGSTDLLICDFVVNDAKLIYTTAEGETADRSAYRTMLGIVQQARAWNPDVAIVFVLSPVREYPTGQTPLHEEYRTSYETVLRFVHDQGIAFVDLIEAFFATPVPPPYDPQRLFDGPHHAGNYKHPAPQGHALFAETLVREVHRMTQLGTTEFRVVDPLPDDLLPYPREPRVLWATELDQLSSIDRWQAQINQEDWVAHPLYMGRLALFATTSDATLTVPFEGTAIGLWWAWDFGAQKASGRVRIFLDGTELGAYAQPTTQPQDKPLRRFIPLATGLDPNQPHELVVRVLPSAGIQRLALHGVLIEQ